LNFFIATAILAAPDFLLGARSRCGKKCRRGTRVHGVLRSVEVLSQAASRTHQTVSNKIIIHRPARGYLRMALPKQPAATHFSFFLRGLPNAETSFV